MTAPKAYLQQYTKGIIIDEVQYLPELLSYIQVLADELEQTQFILTGSNNFTLVQSETQSLAGRAAKLTLLPLSLQKIGSEINASTLSNEVGVSVPTIQEWLSVLETSYVLFRLELSKKTIRKILGRVSKEHDFFQDKQKMY